MAEKYSELELALNTLVKEFHGASENNAATLNSEQFEKLATKQLPTMTKADGVNQLLLQMGVENGQSVSFENFWTLVQSLATQLYGLKSNEKTAKCTCLLQ